MTEYQGSIPHLADNNLQGKLTRFAVGTGIGLAVGLVMMGVMTGATALAIKVQDKVDTKRFKKDHPKK